MGAAPPADEPVLRIRGLVKTYGAVRAVDDVSFDLRAGEVLTLLGPSGCGKSTTLRMIAGLEQPDGGEVWVRGRLVASAAKQIMVPPEGRKVGLVFQSYAIWPHMTVADNIAYPLKVRRIDRDTIAAKVADIIRLVKLDGLAGRVPNELSGGQQQRVALARALVYEPDLLLLDEPLSNLDSVLRKEMRAQLKALQSRLATTVLYVTHDQEEAMSLSSRVVVMNHGRIEQIDAPAAVYERPATRFVQDFVGQTIRLRGIAEGDGTRIRIGGSTLAVREAMRAGAAVEVSMRPEDVLLLSEAGAGDSGLAGQIVEVTYYGDRLECAIRIDGAEDQMVVVNAEKRQSVAAGDRVFLGIDTARVKLWPI
ncbi:MAG TPA: ABC transporter ATP-binding protein [Stellaceae bacterium]|nr:ABC transporter ATP-binding protein [Stellaceae bacterium]